MNREAAHTAVPWEREQAQGGECTGPGDNPPGYAGGLYETNRVGWYDREADVFHPVADCYHGADAAFIVRAANSHDEMVAACVACEKLLFRRGDPFDGDDWEAMQMIRAVIAKATSGPPRV